MLIKSIYFVVTICLTTMLQAISGEIKVSQYKITYDTPKNKYFALLLSKRIPIMHRELYKLTGLRCQKHISIHIINESNFIKEYKISDNNFSTFDTSTSINIILSHNRLKNAIHPFEILIKKKILFALFRQNNIPQNFWFEDSFFEILLYEKYHLGGISIPNLNTNAHFRFLREDIKSWEVWIDKPSKVQVTSIKNSLRKVSNTKFLILNDWYHYQKKKDAKLRIWVKKLIYLLIKKKSWQLFLSNKFMEENFQKLNPKRNVYSYTMQSFNYPNNDRIEDSSKYIFKYSLRKLLNKKIKLSTSLFRLINFYPVNSSYFPELGIYLTKNNKEENTLWLEYYLLNLKKKTPVDFNRPKDIKRMIAQTINQPVREFSLKGENLELFRTIQFALFAGNLDLSKELNKIIIESNNNHLELLNLYWSIGILINDKKSLSHFKKNAHLYKASVWNSLQPYLNQ